MSTKPIFSFNNATPNSTATPFWAQSTNPKKDTAKKVFKQIWKWLKIAIFAFMMLMGLWGCFQSMWDPTVATNPTVGGGLEFGFYFGQTGDYRYDISGNFMAQYHTFSYWTLDYGPFYAFFVWPGAQLVINIMYPLRNWWGGTNALLAIFVLLLIIRSLSLVISVRSTMQNERMNEVQGKIAEINAKYKDLKDMQSKQMKQQETMDVYKKYNIKPFAAFEQMFITMPIFLIVYRVVTILRPLKATNLFGIWSFGLTPLSQIFSSNFTNTDINSGPMGWTFIFFLLIIIPVQFLSMRLPQIWAKRRSRDSVAVSSKGNKQQGRMKIIQIVFTVVMCGIVAFSAVGVGVYWFLSSLFSITQAFIIHKLILRKREKDKLKSKIDSMTFN